MGYNGYTDKKKESNRRYLAKQAEIRIRLAPEEKKAIEAMARQAEKSVNSYIKDVILYSDR